MTTENQSFFCVSIHYLYICSLEINLVHFPTSSSSSSAVSTLFVSHFERTTSFYAIQNENKTKHIKWTTIILPYGFSFCYNSQCSFIFHCALCVCVCMGFCTSFCFSHTHTHSFCLSLALYHSISLTYTRTLSHSWYFPRNSMLCEAKLYLNCHLSAQRTSDDRHKNTQIVVCWRIDRFILDSIAQRVLMEINNVKQEMALPWYCIAWADARLMPTHTPHIIHRHCEPLKMS